MKLELGTRWRHVKSKDVDLIFLSLISETPDYIKVKVMFFNRNYNILLDTTPDVVTIQRKHFKNWKEVV